MTSISPSFPSSSNHSYASALFSSSASLSPILQHKKPQPKKSHIPSSSWADQVDEARNNNNSKQNGNKKQKLNQIMNWSTKPKPNNKSRPHLLPRNTNNTNKSAHNNNISNTNISSHQHKDGEKQIDLVWALAQQVEDEERKREALVAHLDKDGKEEVEGERDNREKDTCSDSFSLVSDSHSSCDSYSTVSGDSMSCDTASSISCESEEKDKKKKKKKNKKRKRKFNAADEGKKVFVGGITFEDCGSFLSKDNETLAALRQKKFSEIFYLFGSVYRIQGHWESGYCFVVYNKRRDAKLAIKCLSMAKVRRKVVQNLRDNIAPTGVLPLPSFYVRWANNPTKPSSSSSSSSSDPTPSISEDVKEKESEEVEEKEMDGEDEKGQMDWVHTLKEEDLVEEDVERLMRELLKLNGDSI